MIVGGKGILEGTVGGMGPGSPCSPTLQSLVGGCGKEACIAPGKELIEPPIAYRHVVPDLKGHALLS